MGDFRSSRWVKLYVRIMDNPIWTQLSPAVFKIALGIVMMANYQDAEEYDGSGYLQVPRGSLFISLPRLSTLCGVSVQQIRDALNHLERTRFATCKGTRTGTVITVCNYELYQSCIVATEHAKEHVEEHAEEHAKEHAKEHAIKERVDIRSVDSLKPLAAGAAVNGSDYDPNRHRNRTKNYPVMTEFQSATFKAFWYPNYWTGQSKKAAAWAWVDLLKGRDQLLVDKIMAAVARQKPMQLDRARRGSTMIYAASWLNGGNFEDEIPEEFSLTADGSMRVGGPISFAERNEEIRRKKFREGLMEDFADGRL